MWIFLNKFFLILIINWWRTWDSIFVLLKNGWDDWSKSDDRVQLETKWCKISKVSNWSRTGTWLVGASAHNGPYVEVSDRESPVSHRWKLSSIKRLPLDCMAQSLGSVRWPSYTRQISSFFIFCHIKATPKKKSSWSIEFANGGYCARRCIHSRTRL